MVMGLCNCFTGNSSLSPSMSRTNILGAGHDEPVASETEIFIGSGLCGLFNCVGCGSTSPSGSPAATGLPTGYHVPQLVEVSLRQYKQTNFEKINLTQEQLKADLDSLKGKGQGDIIVCALMISCALRLDKSFLNGRKEVNLNEVLDDTVNIRAFRAKDVGGQKEFSFSSDDQESVDSVTCLFLQGFKSLMPQDFEDFYVGALSKCVAFDAVGGKSKPSFCKTQNQHFILKEIKPTEFETFEKFGDKYIHHLDNRTALNKPWGVYKVVRNNDTTYVIVTDNIWIEGDGSMALYDLKGLSRRSSNPATTGLDENFADEMANSGFSLSHKDMKDLLASVQNDCNFLQSVGVMDYSLLVVWNKQQGKIAYGIIDYLSRFTFLKMSEFIYKSSKNLFLLKWKQPTIVPPRIYGNRLTNFVRKTCKTNSSNEEMLISDASGEVMSDT